ncbi:immunoglobulin-binding protein 1 [Neosynchiropus ocellatus]
MAEKQNSNDAQQSNTEPVKLSELLDRGWKAFEEVDRTDEPLASNSVQVKVRRGIAALEETSSMVAQLDLFSRNEDLEEVATADLKYLLASPLLGALTLKITGKDKRLEALLAARTYFMDFLKRCKEYNLSKFELPSVQKLSPDQTLKSQPPVAKPSSSQADLVAMAAQRQAKIERYRQKKELEARLDDVRKVVESGQADEETSRDFYLLNIRRWVAVSLEEIESIDQEMEILKTMAQGAPETSRPARPPMKPFVLTKDVVQAQVFGAGYPSLPTMTVDDWYEQHRKHGALPDQGIPHRVSVDEDTDAKEREEEEKERKADEDDEEALKKAREWDSWKDTHQRGYGNRHNMG